MEAALSASDAPAATGMTPAGRRAVLGACLGYFADMFDIYLPVVVLVPASAYFQPGHTSPGVAAILAAMVFAATLLGRPVGALIFGHFGDKIGRRRTTIVAFAGFGVATLLIGALPGYERIGLASIGLLIALRFVDGVFLGGEYTAATPLAMEYSPKLRRGFYGGLITNGFPLAYCLISGLTLLMLEVAPAGGVHSPYAQWGWRVPFFIGALIALALALYYTFGVEESVVWQEAPKARAPLRELLRGRSLRDFGQVFVFMTGIWLASNVTTALLPLTLKTDVGLSAKQVTVALVIASAVLIVAYPSAGALSQRIGRRPFFIGYGMVVAVGASVVFALLAGRVVSGLAGNVVLVVAMYLFAITSFGPVATYLTERFRVGVRASGYGLGYSLALIIPSFYAFYLAGLAHLMPMRYAPVVLLVVGGLLLSIGAVAGPETRDVDMGVDAAVARTESVSASSAGT